MEAPRAEVIVASTLYLMSAWVLDPSSCGCRVHAIVAHLERLMQMDGLDPVIRATAIQLHEHWQRVANQIGDSDETVAATNRTWH
jgi:hypothetical protein